MQQSEECSVLVTASAATQAVMLQAANGKSEKHLCLAIAAELQLLDAVASSSQQVA